jgi:hypothetical protein
MRATLIKWIKKLRIAEALVLLWRSKWWLAEIGIEILLVGLNWGGGSH